MRSDLTEPDSADALLWWPVWSRAKTGCFGSVLGFYFSFHKYTFLCSSFWFTLISLMGFSPVTVFKHLADTWDSFFSHGNLLCTSGLWSWSLISSFFSSGEAPQNVSKCLSFSESRALHTLPPTAEQTLIVAFFYCQPLCCPFFCCLCVSLSFPFCWTCSSAFLL